MKTILSLVCCSALLVGCASTQSEPESPWIVNFSVDEFTDQKRCVVTVGSVYTSGGVYSYNAHYYPFIEERDGELWFGVRSGGNYKIPVGDVQVRIDSNKAWDISTSETPSDPNSLNVYNIEDYMQHVSEAQKQQIMATYDGMMANAQKATLPYTVATGDKAKNIIEQMQNGEKMIYRIVGFNQTKSTTGEFKLGPSLETALDNCNIQI